MLQGEALVPYIFIVVIDWVMRNPNIDDFGFTRHKCQSSRILEKRISDLEYTYNNGFIENEKDKAQVQPDGLSSVAKEEGLVINEDKKKSYQKTLNQNKLNETVLEMVDDVQYLGAWVNGTMKYFKHLREKAWTTFWKLKKSWAPTLTSN